MVRSSPVLSLHTASPWRCCRRCAPTPSSRNRLWCRAAGPGWRCTPCGSCSPEDTEVLVFSSACRSAVRVCVVVRVCSWRWWSRSRGRLPGRTALVWWNHLEAETSVRDLCQQEDECNYGAADVWPPGKDLIMEKWLQFHLLTSFKPTWTADCHWIFIIFWTTMTTTFRGKLKFLLVLLFC